VALVCRLFKYVDFTIIIIIVVVVVVVVVIVVVVIVVVVVVVFENVIDVACGGRMGLAVRVDGRRRFAATRGERHANETRHSLQEESLRSCNQSRAHSTMR
jgi:flagellar basal body-associated protein FliL